MNELNELISAVKLHLNEEEDLPLDEICTAETLLFYQKRIAKKPQPQQNQQYVQQPTSASPAPIQRSQPIVLTTPPATKLPERKLKTPLPPLPSTSLPQPPAETMAAPAKIDHGMFKELCQELFPELELRDSKKISHPKVIILHSPQIKDHLHTFLHKIAEAIRAKGIDVTLTTPASAQQLLGHVQLIIGDNEMIEGLPDFTKEKTILPLENLETLSADTEKKKKLWQDIRKILKI